MKSEDFATTRLYADIIDLPHYEPKHHPRMSMWSRAAQFAPFSALTGYEDALQDTKEMIQESFEQTDYEEDELV